MEHYNRVGANDKEDARPWDWDKLLHEIKEELENVAALIRIAEDEKSSYTERRPRSGSEMGGKRGGVWGGKEEKSPENVFLPVPVAPYPILAEPPNKGGGKRGNIGGGGGFGGGGGGGGDTNRLLFNGSTTEEDDAGHKSQSSHKLQHSNRNGAPGRGSGVGSSGVGGRGGGKGRGDANRAKKVSAKLDAVDQPLSQPERGGGKAGARSAGGGGGGNRGWGPGQSSVPPKTEENFPPLGSK